jgi:hypothetical protein
MGGNTASLKVARGSGFKHMKSHRDIQGGGGPVTTVEIFALTAADYYDLPY